MIHARRKLCVSIIRTILSSAAPSHELTLAHARGGDHLSQWRNGRHASYQTRGLWITRGSRYLESRFFGAQITHRASYQRVSECTVAFSLTHTAGDELSGELANVQFGLTHQELNLSFDFGGLTYPAKRGAEPGVS